MPFCPTALGVVGPVTSQAAAHLDFTQEVHLSPPRSFHALRLGYLLWYRFHRLLPTSQCKSIATRAFYSPTIVALPNSICIATCAKSVLEAVIVAVNTHIHTLALVTSLCASSSLSIGILASCPLTLNSARDLVLLGAALAAPAAVDDRTLLREKVGQGAETEKETITAAQSVDLVLP